MNRGVLVLRSISGHPRWITNRRFATTAVCGLQNTYLANNRDSHVTSTFRTFAKAAKKGKNDKNDKDDAEGPGVALPDPKATEASMSNALKKLTNELSKIRNGAVSADMFNEVPIDSYGFVGSAGQVTVKSPTKITISVYDPSCVQDIVNAIRNHTKMGLNPSIEGSTISINVPKPSKEFRDDMLKQAALTTERTKAEVRGYRKDTMDAIKKCSKASGVSEDDVKKLSKEIETVTEKKIEAVVKLFKAKEKEIASS
jgi:ribosome recycling factor